MPDFTEIMKRSICCLIRNPKREITYAWLVSLVLVLVIFIVAAVSASKMAQGNANVGESAPVSAFVAVWTAILLIFISVFGTIIMRRFQTAISIGSLIGVIFIMTQQLLILFAIFVERSQSTTASDTVISSCKAMAVFTFFLFLVYASFGTMLTVFRDDIIKQEVSPSDIPEEEYHEGDDSNVKQDDMEEVEEEQQ